MPILTYSELNAICVEATNPLPFYPPVYNSFLVDLYNTGCRPNELTDQDLWNTLSPTTFSLQPLKGNNLRYFSDTQLSVALVNWLTGGNQDYNYCTYSKMKNIWRNNSSSPQVYKDQKPMDLYCFRYRFVKSLALSGYSDTDIQGIMGWVELSMVDEYKNAVLYT